MRTRLVSTKSSLVAPPRSGTEEYWEQDQLLEEILTIAKENGYKIRIFKKAPLGPGSQSISTVNKSTSGLAEILVWIELATAVFMIASKWSYMAALTTRRVRVAKSVSDGVHVTYVDFSYLRA